MDTVKIKKSSTKIIAHRGLSSLERENTNAAFVAAGNRNYWGIESDVRRTADNQYVIFHDPETTRVIGENHVVEEQTLETLRAFNLKDMDGQPRSDLKIPTLEEYIRVCKKYEKIAVLELKSEFVKEEIIDIVHIIDALGYLDNTVFISFVLKNLQLLREYKKHLSAQFLTTKPYTAELLAILKENELDLDINHSHLNQEIVKELHENGIKVNCWTCDDGEAAEKLMEYGVDFITTNKLQPEF